MTKMKTRWSVLLLAGMLLIGISALANDDDDIGAVFVGTNHNNTMDKHQPPNQVAMYLRFNDGSLSLWGYYNTGGQGSGPSRRFAGDGLGAAHSVQLSEDHKWLFVTNAGSNNVSVFRVRLGEGDRGRPPFAKFGLELTDLQSTGDGSPSHRFPNSVAQHGDLVYVLNSADQGSITGFRLTGNGQLVPIPHSTRLLSANQTYPPDTIYNPVQVSFTPDGQHLVVAIKDGPAAGLIPGVTPTGPGRVLVFDVGRDGQPSNTYQQNNFNHHGPFGFSFDQHGNLLIALFVGGPNLTAAAGSFRFHDDDLIGITPDVPDTQQDTCWLENNGKYAYGANYSSGTVSSFTIGSNGSLKLLEAVAGTTNHPGNIQGSTPLDLRVSPNGKFVYDVLPGSGNVAGWRINRDGSLTKIGEWSGLPKTVNGDMAPQERFGPGGSPAGIDIL
jgi:6-phosphogluconolactonase (cycloisomerase 2 family)